MKLSIIIPCYNCEKYIRECLDSVLKAVGADDEVICIDDGSTDRTPSMLQDIHDRRVTVITQVNCGPGAARNAGIEASTGDQLIFADADDVISPMLIAAVKEQPEDSLVSRQLCMKRIRSQELPDRLASSDRRVPDSETTLPAGQVRIGLLNAAYPPVRVLTDAGYDIYGPIAKNYCRAVLERYHIRFPENLKWGEDICFNLQYTAHIEQTVFLPINAYWYRTVPSSLIHRFVPGKRDEIQLFLKCAQSILQNPTEDELDAFRFLAVKQYIYILQYDLCNRYNPDPFSVRRQTAWALKGDNSIVRDAFANCKSLGMSRSISLTVFMIRLNWFAALDLFLKVYASLRG